MMEVGYYMSGLCERNYPALSFAYPEDFDSLEALVCKIAQRGAHVVQSPWKTRVDKAAQIKLAAIRSTLRRVGGRNFALRVGQESPLGMLRKRREFFPLIG